MDVKVKLIHDPMMMTLAEPFYSFVQSGILGKTTTASLNLCLFFNDLW